MSAIADNIKKHMLAYADTQGNPEYSKLEGINYKP
jgi:hypothetical protein